MLRFQQVGLQLLDHLETFPEDRVETHFTQALHPHLMSFCAGALAVDISQVAVEAVLVGVGEKYVSPHSEACLDKRDT